MTVVARVASYARVRMERALSPAAFFHVHCELQEKKRAGVTAAPPAGKRVRQDGTAAEKKTQKCFGRGCNSKKGKDKTEKEFSKEEWKRSHLEDKRRRCLVCEASQPRKRRPDA